MRSGVRNSSAPSAGVSRSPLSTLSAIVKSAGSPSNDLFSATRGGTSVLEASDHERNVMPAETEAVRQRHADVALGRLVRCVVEIQLGVRRLVVDGRRDGALANDVRAYDEL